MSVFGSLIDVDNENLHQREKNINKVDDAFLLLRNMRR